MGLQQLLEGVSNDTSNAIDQFFGVSPSAPPNPLASQPTGTAKAGSAQTSGGAGVAGVPWGMVAAFAAAVVVGVVIFKKA